MDAVSQSTNGNAGQVLFLGSMEGLTWLIKVDQPQAMRPSQGQL